MKQRIYKIIVMGPMRRRDDEIDRWWLRIVARNGEIVAYSENYPTKRIALKTARALAGAKLVVEEP